MRTSIRHFIGIFLLFFGYASPVFASHIVGGGFTYRYLGDTVMFGFTKQKYEVTLELYQDCAIGQPDAIAQDNPAYFTAYETGTNAFVQNDTNIYFDPASSVLVGTTMDSLSNPCGNITPIGPLHLCLQKKKFVKIYYLDPNSTGYTITYQRCCRNSNTLNVMDPGNKGMTIFCTIPPTHNNSAVFNSYPPQLICFDQPTIFIDAATDADGDSLSYELGEAYEGADGQDIKPIIASPPPYAPVVYASPYSVSTPIQGSAPLHIDAVTGKLTVTCNIMGRFLIVVLCKEWRGGVLINTTRMEFQWVVTNCGNPTGTFKVDAGKNQTILVDEKIQFNATGAKRYSWYPTNFLNDPYVADPIGTFTEKGIFTYVLYGTTDLGCNGSDTVTITVLEHSDFTVPNAFTPNGDGINDRLIPMPMGNSTLKLFRVFNRLGNMLYQTTSPGVGWDGTYNGTRQDPGVYAWSVEFTDNYGTPRVKGGTTILLR